MAADITHAMIVCSEKRCLKYMRLNIGMPNLRGQDCPVLYKIDTQNNSIQFYF